MKVIEIIPAFEPLGGAENFVYHLSNSLSKKGIKVKVISLYDKKNDFIDKELKKNNIEIVYFKKRKGIDFKLIKSLYFFLKKERPDVVHLHLNTVISSLCAILFTKIKFIYTFHTHISKKTYGHKLKPINLMLKLLIKFKFVFPITISNEVDNSFVKFFGNYNRKMIANGIDISKFTYEPTFEKKYDFISIGSFNDIKNNLFMIKSVEKLINEGWDVNYVVLGNGKNFDICKEYCVSKKIDNKILLCGAVNNVEDYLKESSCLLMASLWEGNPLSANEAIASGVWVIAYSVGGLIDIINPTNGYLAEALNEDDFIKKMKKYLLNRRQITDSIIPNNIILNRDAVNLENTTYKYIEVIKKYGRK